MKINNLGVFVGSDGKRYEVIETIQVIHSKSINNPSKHDGSRSYKTFCGIPVNVKNGTFFTWDNVELKPDL